MPINDAKGDAVRKSFVKPLSAYYLREKVPVPTFRDLRVYQKVFRPFGLTWLQFMLLQSSGAIQWVETFNKGDVLFQLESDIILVYTGDAYIWEIDQIVKGDRVQSNKGYTIIGQTDLSLLNPSMQQQLKESNESEQQQLVCIESRSDELVFLRFDTKQMTGGGVDMDDLLQDRDCAQRNKFEHDFFGIEQSVLPQSVNTKGFLPMLDNERELPCRRC
eukprot:scaffold437_cov288-Chaetoceros_neogracile.AAC.62